MTPEDLSVHLQSWVETHRRSGWKPIVAAGDRSVSASKFSGMPWLAQGEAYPCCGTCGTPMPLFLQLNLADLPTDLVGKFGSGLLQLFYCTSDDCDGDGWEAFSSEKVTRFVQPEGQPQSLPTGSYPSFPPQTIVGWEEQIDYPSFQEWEPLGLMVDGDFSPDMARTQCPAVASATDDDLINALDDVLEPLTATPGDKLAGYPYWVQGVEYPNCPVCDRTMQLVFQLDSNDNLPFMFGDVGCGHITQCPEHQHIVTFAWACG